MTVICIDAYYLCVLVGVLILCSIAIGYVLGEKENIKKYEKYKEYYNKQLKFKYDERLIRDLISRIDFNPEKETLDNITELLLIDNISDDSIKLRFIKEAIREYLKKGIGDIT